MREAEAPGILIIDSEPDSYAALLPVLEQHGWIARQALSAAEGFEKLQSRSYEVVLLEIRPASGGCDLLRRVRVLRPESKVLAMASGHAPSDVVCAIREHAYSLFTRPFPVLAVADAIAQALATSSWEDDIEVLSASPRWITLRVRCKMEAVDRLVQFLRELEADLAPGVREDVAAALRELLLNAIEHGGRADPQQRIRVSYLRTARSVVYHIQDPGPGFSFGSITHAAVANPPDQPVRHVEIRAEQGVRPGGFGILLTRNLVDELVYNEKGNEVLFVKYLDGTK